MMVLSIVLFGLNGWVSAKKYNEQISRYNQGLSNTKRWASTVGTGLYMQPSSLVFAVDGDSRHAPPGYMLSPKCTLKPMSAGLRNFKMPFVPEMDWVFIIKVVFSLYALLLAFRGISGEKECGTLRLILSHSIKRNVLLLAKYVSILLTIGIPLLVGILVSLSTISVLLPTAISLSILPKIILMTLVALFYLSVFIFLGLLVSSLFSRSSVVLLIVLSVWILFVIVVPNVSGILSDKLAKVPSEFQTARQVGPLIDEQIWTRIHQIINSVKKGELTDEQEIKRQSDRVFEQGREQLQNHYAIYENAMKQRARMARNLSRLSPAAQFQYACEGLADTGPGREARFLKDAKAYSGIYDDYILQKVGTLVGYSGRVFGSSFVAPNGKPMELMTPVPKQYEGDKSDFPVFTESRTDIQNNLKEASLDLAGLAIWNLILAMLAFAAISHCDVR
jgi:ABC-type transport system involved in multi-copper enzyme maturation permease subunit